MRKPNRFGCVITEDVCIMHDSPLACKHGCVHAIKHECKELDGYKIEKLEADIKNLKFNHYLETDRLIKDKRQLEDDLESSREVIKEIEADKAMLVEFVNKVIFTENWADTEKNMIECLHQLICEAKELLEKVRKR